MLAEITVTGVPAAIVIAGTLAGLASIYLFTQDRSEVGSKWLGSALGLIALGILLAAFL